ncbi:MAG TPA: redoxin domain-containing protein, partial [Cellvibrionaceae bacterium]
AGCPLCNLRVHELSEAYPMLSDALSMVAIFQSPAATMTRYVAKQDAPFALIADPEREHYRRFKVEKDVGGLLRVMASPGRLLGALKRGFWPGAIDGPLHTIPADFLIDERGVIHTAYYGCDIGDHLPLEDIYSFIGREAKI